MENMKQAYEYIKTQVDMDKIYEEGGLQVFRDINELTDEFGITGAEVAARTNWKDFDFNQLNKPFVAYDFGGEDFTFLTNNDDAAAQAFIDYINSK